MHLVDSSITHGVNCGITLDPHPDIADGDRGVLMTVDELVEGVDVLSVFRAG